MHKEDMGGIHITMYNTNLVSQHTNTNKVTNTNTDTNIAINTNTRASPCIKRTWGAYTLQCTHNTNLLSQNININKETNTNKYN